LVFIFLLSCSKEEECQDRIDLGIIETSEESNRYVLPSYFDTLSEIVFISITGSEMSFRPKKPVMLIQGTREIYVACDNTEPSSTRIRFKSTSNWLSLISDDSLIISMSQGTNPTDSSYYDYISNSLFDVTEGRFLRQSFIVTDLKFTEEVPDSIPIGNNFHEEIEIAGKLFSEVWSGKDSNLLPDLFIKKDFGCIGFIDENGMEWRIKE